MNVTASPHHLPDASTIRRMVETLDRRLLALFDEGDEPDDATIGSIARLEIARNAALRLLAQVEAPSFA